MKSNFLLSLAFIGATTNNHAKAAKIDCTDNSVTFTYERSDLEKLANAQITEEGISNKPGPYLQSACLTQTIDGIATPGPGIIDVTLHLQAYWEGILDPLRPEHENKIMFDIETVSDELFEVAHYRIGNMNRKVVSILGDGRNAIEANSYSLPFKVKAYQSETELNNLRVRICEIRPNVEITIKKIVIRSELARPELCGQ